MENFAEFYTSNISKYGVMIKLIIICYYVVVNVIANLFPYALQGVFPITNRAFPPYYDGIGHTGIY